MSLPLLGVEHVEEAAAVRLDHEHERGKNLQRLCDSISRTHSTPPTSKAYDRPDFHRGLDFARRFARKGREMAPVYAGWDDVKVILLATSPLAEADCAPFMTRGPDPLWASMATPPGPGFAQLAQGVVAAVALGWRSLAEADSGRIHDCWACPPKGHLWRALYLRLCQTRRRMCEDAWAAEYDPLNTIRH